jgi:type IV pilus assembly protein PilF
MRIIAIAALCAGAAMAAGCVTEGGLALEPASDDEQAQANLRVGIGYLQQERPEVAIDALLRALEIDPRLTDAHSAIALAYDQTGELELAEQHYIRATQLAPSSAAPQNSLAVFLCRQDRWEDAKPYYQRAIDLAGNRGIDYMFNAAICARSSGDLESAVVYYRSVLDIEGANPDALRAIVQTSIQREDYLTGRAFWQRLEQNGQLSAEDWLSCYVIEAGAGDTLAAGQCAARLRAEFPGSSALRQLNILEQNGGR